VESAISDSTRLDMHQVGAVLLVEHSTLQSIIHVLYIQCSSVHAMLANTNVPAIQKAIAASHCGPVLTDLAYTEAAEFNCIPWADLCASCFKL